MTCNHIFSFFNMCLLALSVGLYRPANLLDVFRAVVLLFVFFLPKKNVCFIFLSCQNIEEFLSKTAYAQRTFSSSILCSFGAWGCVCDQFIKRYTAYQR